MELRDVQKRFDKWAKWRHIRHYVVMPGAETIESRIIEANFSQIRHRSTAYAVLKIIRRRAKTKGHMPCNQTRASGGDGGMYRNLRKLEGAMRFDSRCRQIEELYERMSKDQKKIIGARYIGHSQEVPRTLDEAAELVGLPRSTYFDQHRAILKWVGERLESQSKRAEPGSIKAA